MTAAGRRRHHHAQMRDSVTKHVTEPSVEAELRAQLAKRDAEIERLRKAAAAPEKPQQPTDSHDLAEARKEIERLRNELAGSRRQPPPFPRTAEEWLAQKQRGDEAQKVRRAAAREAAATMSAEEEATLQEKLQQAEKQLAANKTRIMNLTAHIRYVSFNPPPPRMSKWLYRQIRALIHPDKVRDDAAKLKPTKFSQEFNAIKFKFPDDE